MALGRTRVAWLPPAEKSHASRCIRFIVYILLPIGMSGLIGRMGRRIPFRCLGVSALVPIVRFQRERKGTLRRRWSSTSHSDTMQGRGGGGEEDPSLSRWMSNESFTVEKPSSLKRSFESQLLESKRHFEAAQLPRIDYDVE